MRNEKLETEQIGLIKSVLESGNSVELPATGYSMFPTLKPGDKVIIRPLSHSELPKPGTVVVYENNGVLVMHRLLDIISEKSGKQVFITRGDSGIEPDKPLSHQQLLGTTVIYKRAGKEHPVRVYIPGAWRYKFNRRMLWLYNRIKY